MLNLSEFSQGRCLNVLLIHAMRGLEIQRNKQREIRKQGRTNVQHKTSTWWVTEWVLLAPETTDCKLAPLCIYWRDSGDEPSELHSSPPAFFFPSIWSTKQWHLYKGSEVCGFFRKHLLFDRSQVLYMYLCMYVSIYLSCSSRFVPFLQAKNLSGIGCMSLWS